MWMNIKRKSERDFSYLFRIKHKNYNIFLDGHKNTRGREGEKEHREAHLRSTAPADEIYVDRRRTLNAFYIRSLCLSLCLQLALVSALVMLIGTKLAVEGRDASLFLALLSQTLESIKSRSNLWCALEISPARQETKGKSTKESRDDVKI